MKPCWTRRHDCISEKARRQIIEQVIKPVIPKKLWNDDIVFHINPTGKFVVGGPHGDTGLTGRKIIVDSYGGRGAHGGGAFSGKDPSPRWIAAPATWAATSPRTSWPRVWPAAPKCSLPTRSAWPIRFP